MNQVLGVGVSSNSMGQVLEKIENRVKEKENNGANQRPLWIVTAYSEFFLKAVEDSEFGRAINHASLVVADGVSALAAVDFARLITNHKSQITRLLFGMSVGWKVITGKYDQRVTGVSLARNILESGQYKIMLLGGWEGVAARLAAKCKEQNARSKIESLEGPRDIMAITEAENSRMLAQINTYEPDVLLVAFGQYRQEKWIAKNVFKIGAKVVIGVGSAFDELMGDGIWAQPAPAWVERMGLKWLWRAVNDPRHWRRAWRAAAVFPWKVFRASA